MDSLIDSVTVIAKGIGRGRFRDDVMGEAYLEMVAAEAEGCSREEIERRVRVQCRNSNRRQWREENRISFEIPVRMKRQVYESTDAGAIFALNRAIDSLPTRQRHAVNLRFRRGLAHAGIAVELGCTVRASHGVLARALESIKVSRGKSRK